MTTNLTAPHAYPKPGSQPGHDQGNCYTLIVGARSPIINGRVNGHLVFELEPAYQYAPPEIVRQWQRRGWSLIALETGVALHGLPRMIEALEADEPGACPFCEVRPIYGRIEGRESYLDDYEVTNACGLHKRELK